ncbi:MAG TPA: ATPase, T2SS/T4P/T4SS family, partial [Candidatus Ozemobacteraceae bacterium]|nr:ATPase, T2SS/T4P/T4SS family [Candidatus Ozemobacteraceae bacterium]
KTLGQTTTMAMRPGKVLWDPLQKKIRELTEKKKPAAPVKKGPRKRLGDIIVESKYATEEQMKEAIEGAKKEKLRLGAYLVKKGTLSNKQLSIALSKQFDIPYIDLEESLVDPVLATLLPKKLCYEHILCPVKKEENKIVIAMTDPTDIITIDHIEMMTGMRLSPVVSSELAIVSALDKLYGETADALADQVGNKEESNDLPDELAGDLNENAAPIIKLVNLVLTQAAQTGTSDIHIEPFEHEVKIRFRKDGMMKMFMTPNKAAHAAIVSRIKVMSNLDIAETRLPQDGRIKMTLGSRRVDLRVSCVPCVWGEKVCMRLLDQGNLKVNLNDLGFEPRALDNFMEGVKSPNGIVLVTGPTGSGKTTTLYSCLHLLN